MFTRIIVFALIILCDCAPTWMNLLNQCQNPHDAWSTFQNIKQPNIRHYKKMISICRGNPQQVQYFLNKMRKEQIEPDAITFTIALNAFKRDLPRFQKVWNDMKTKGIETNVSTFDIALCAFKDDLPQFREVWKEMKKKGIEPSIIAWSTAVRALKHDPLEFQELWDQWRFGRNQGLFNAALVAFKDDSMKMVEVHNEMTEKGFIPDADGFDCLIDVMGRLGEFEEAWSLFEKMKQAGLNSNFESATPVIFDVENVSESEIILRTMTGQEEKVPFHNHWGPVIKVLREKYPCKLVAITFEKQIMSEFTIVQQNNLIQ